MNSCSFLKSQLTCLLFQLETSLFYPCPVITEIMSHFLSNTSIGVIQGKAYMVTLALLGSTCPYLPLPAFTLSSWPTFYSTSPTQSTAPWTQSRLKAFALADPSAWKDFPSAIPSVFYSSIISARWQNWPIYLKCQPTSLVSYSLPWFICFL